MSLEQGPATEGFRRPDPAGGEQSAIIRVLQSTGGTAFIYIDRTGPDLDHLEPPDWTAAEARQIAAQLLEAADALDGLGVLQQVATKGYPAH